jgi:hypothetical protein
MPTVGEKVLRHHALGHLNRLKRLGTKKMKKAASERVPMESQIGKVLEEAGIEYVKPATIIKRIVAKGKPVPEGASKFSQSEAGPGSSHHQLGVRRDKPELQIGQDDTNPKLAREYLKQALATSKQMLSKHKNVNAPLGGRPVKPAKSTGISVSTKMPKQQGASPPPVLPMAPMAPMQPFSS